MTGAACNGLERFCAEYNQDFFILSPLLFDTASAFFLLDLDQVRVNHSEASVLPKLHGMHLRNQDEVEVNMKVVTAHTLSPSVVGRKCFRLPRLY